MQRLVIKKAFPWYVQHLTRASGTLAWALCQIDIIVKEEQVMQFPPTSYLIPSSQTSKLLRVLVVGPKLLPMRYMRF